MSWSLPGALRSRWRPARSRNSSARPSPLLPSGEGAKLLSLAGPGIGQPTAELVLVPLHPQTGQVWQPSGGPVVVPVEAMLWAELAFPPQRTRLPVVGGLPTGVERDDPLLPLPRSQFWPSRYAFQYTLARMPAVRELWLRAIYDCEY
ncbi:hypothetical protein [Kitasatospora sp. P5_F3]